MPRKTQSNYQFGPVEPISSVGLLDSNGNPVTDTTDKAVRAKVVADETNIAKMLEEQTEELRRIRRASELMLGDDVEDVEQ